MKKPKNTSVSVTPLLTKQIACTHVPARTFCALAYDAAKAGKPELAVELSDRADAEMERLQNDENLVSPVGMLICYFLSHNPAKAWSYFEKSLPWYLEDDAYSRFDYACYLLEGLQGLDTSDAVTLHLPAEIELFDSRHTYTIGSLRSYFEREARQYAAAFDARNGGNAFAERLEALKK